RERGFSTPSPLEGEGQGEGLRFAVALALLPRARGGLPWYIWTVMRLGVRQKLVLLSVAVMIVTSFGFAALSLSLTRGWVEDDLKDRAIAFAREIAATIGDRHEFESG